jgi:hypothetical protein
MTGPEHYQAAEKLLDFVKNDNPDADAEPRLVWMANVHATLALAAASALNDAAGGLGASDYDAWRAAASVNPLAEVTS